MVHRVQAFYGLDHWTVIDTPIAAFWGLLRDIDRISAERDRRALRLHLTAGRGDAANVQDIQRALMAEMGVPVLPDAPPERDRAGLLALKSMNTDPSARAWRG
ncbi:hypothetical protein ACIU1J_24440 [Azospirillum doebereinerae]|uniref:hypothetical protein n=1 Tax=Azospirillum doebereinerae TaxID=92933 RepID=UPI001EE50EE1|nr:hypothetical protein [Azospirillum doebereinerae]MCG5242341.1 hypothetical protein [Azospirillum doebereinerae]